ARPGAPRARGRRCRGRTHPDRVPTAGPADGRARHRRTTTHAGRGGLAARGDGQRQHSGLQHPPDPQQAGAPGRRGRQHGPGCGLPVAVRSPSLRARMAATALLVSTITAALLVIGVQVLLDASNDSTAHSRLTTKAEASAATVVRTPRGVRVLEQESPVLDQNVWIFDDSGVLIEGTLS